MNLSRSAAIRLRLRLRAARKVREREGESETNVIIPKTLSALFPQDSRRETSLTCVIVVDDPPPVHGVRVGVAPHRGPEEQKGTGQQRPGHFVRRCQFVHLCTRSNAPSSLLLFFTQLGADFMAKAAAED